MPRTRSLAFSELKIGILAVLAVIITAVVIFMLGGQGGFFWQRYHLKARFPNAAGLKSGAPVRVAGVEVGSVDDVQFSGAQVDVIFSVSKTSISRITPASSATLGAMGLLGQATVDITASTQGPPVPEWGYIPTKVVPAFSDVAVTANAGLERTAALLQDVQLGRGTVGQLFTNDSLYKELDRFIASAQEVTTNLNRGRGTIGALMHDRQAYDNLEASLKNLQAITASISAGEGALGKFLHDEQMATSLKATAANIESVTGKINRGEGSAGKFIADTELYDRLASVSKRLDDLTTGLNAGEGAAGQFLKNRQVYDNLNDAVNQMKALIADIRKDPKKYLNVKVSVF